MNPNITREEQNIRKFTLKFNSNVDYCEFIKVLGSCPNLLVSSVAKSLFEQEFDVIIEDENLKKIYENIKPQ